MQNESCCVIPKELRQKENISEAIFSLSNGGLTCQFELELVARYDYKGEKFCILHFPINRLKENSQSIEEIRYSKDPYRQKRSALESLLLTGNKF